MTNTARKEETKKETKKKRKKELRKERKKSGIDEYNDAGIYR